MKVTDSSAASDFFGDDKWWPPGFRFHPTDEELVLYYLKRKICRRRIKLDIIAEIDVYKWDAEDLPEQSILKTGDRQWFFFSPRSRRYPSGERSNRATRHGYWKVTGKDRSVFSSSRAVGTKKTLVFYRGRAPSGQRTDWVMHEYTVDEEVLKSCRTVLDYYALYKVFKKSGPGPKIGEQYGAPFKEDEWADDACLDVNKHAEAHKPLINTAASDEDDLGVGTLPPLSPLNAIDGVVSYVADDSLGQIQINDRAHTTPQDGGNEETRSTMLEPEVTSAPNISGFEPGSIGGDFLEMDDLDGPHPAVSMPVDIHSFEDGMSEFDRCLDAAWFFQELDPMANQLDCLLPRMNDEGEANGLLCEGTFLQDPPLPSIGTSGLSADQNQGDADGWFTSSLWNFVDSIPSPPASASENAFMNRALGRMSSFNRLRPSPSNAVGNVNNHGDGGGRGLGFLLLSIVGAFCAVFWVFVMRGYLMSSLGRFVPL